MKRLFRIPKPDRHPFPSPRTKEPCDEEDNHAVDFLGSTITAINTAKDLIPIDLAKGILGTVANILIIAQSVIKNKSDFMAIVKICDDIKQILERVTEDNIQGSFGHALSQLNKSVNRINSELASKKERSIFERLLSITIDQNDIVAWEKDLNNAIVLCNLEATFGVRDEVKEMVSIVKSSVNVINILPDRPIVPPSRPSMFYGRNDLVAELTNLVVDNEHIALIGTGGMGKSSLAKAIINEPLVIEKFAERRYFVTYDGLDPTTITFDAFIAHFASGLGIERVGANPMQQISIFLSSATALIVLDNAETFEDASGSSTLNKISSAIAHIADIRGIVLILTSRSRRHAPSVPWITKDIPPLGMNSALEAFFRIYGQASRINCEEEIMKLLKELEFHPLSINLLATAAEQNRWTPPVLLKRWKDRPSAILDLGEGKLESLSTTMGLSLSSPSIWKLGNNGHLTLAAIAFLPQGLNDDLAKDLLPSLGDVTAVCDVLCRQSLVYRQGTFIKILAPIRHYVQNSFPAALISGCLVDIRTFYYETVRQCPEERDGHADIIISDHLNIEHVIAFDLRQIPKDTEETCDICIRFLWCLKVHLPRPTALTPAIFNIIDNPSTCAPKAECLRYLADLYSSLSHLTESMRMYQTAEALYLTSGDHESVAHCVWFRADFLRCKGHFVQAQDVLEDFQRSASWMHVSEGRKALIWFNQDYARIHTPTTPVDELFSRSMEDRMIGLRSKVFHWRAEMYHGEDIIRVKIHLEELLQQCTDTGDSFDSCQVLRGLAEVAFCQGKLPETMDILEKMAELFGRQHPNNVIWSISRKAVIASLLGNYDLARRLIHKTSKTFEFVSLPSTHAFLHRCYGSAQIELNAGKYDMAESHFNVMVEACDIQADLSYKACSFRGQGEVAFARGDITLASKHFAKTRSLCVEMGVPPPRLYSCTPSYALPERFGGWMSFLEGRSPFATSFST